MMKPLRGKLKHYENAGRRKVPRLALVISFAFLFSMLLTASARAHPEGISIVKVYLEPTQIRAVLAIHTRDLGNWFPPLSFPNYVTSVSRELERIGPDLFALHLDSEAVAPSRVTATSPETGMIQVELVYPSSDAALSFRLESRQIGRLPKGHQQWVFVEDARNLPAGQKVGPTILQDNLDIDTVETGRDLPPVYRARVSRGSDTRPVTSQPDQAGSAGETASENRVHFFLKGVEHILTGYDHLLFVAALLLACRSFREGATIITFFTVAHSITLALAAMNIIRLKAYIVEPAIAGTICVVAVENLLHRPNLSARCAITFSFGLIHGLGFASGLQSMNLGSTFAQIFWPLLKFSAGVESGHLTLVILALPLILWLKRAPIINRRCVPAGSFIISMVGAYWLITRVLESVQSG